MSKEAVRLRDMPEWSELNGPGVNFSDWLAAMIFSAPDTVVLTPTVLNRAVDAWRVGTKPDAYRRSLRS